MVGVPRSQGCRNCRRKKKGCDLQKPVCGQCKRLNIACGWDEKKWTFVSQGPEPASSSSVPIRSRSLDALRIQSTNTPPNGPEHRSLSRTAFEIDSDAEFWTLYYPKDDPQTVYISGRYTAPWAKTLQDIAAFDATVRYALSAVATSIVGRTRSDSAVLQESTRLYAKALRDTNLALQDPIRAQSDAVLACCKLLSMYENFRVDRDPGISTQGNDWHKHVEGTCRIVELRGPKKHVSHHGHALFEDARLLAVISGLTRRKPNFFSNVAWHTIPWESSPRNLQDKLLDIMIALPGLLQAQDTLAQKLQRLGSKNDVFTCLTETQNHLNRCIRIGQSLREWEQNTVLACLEQTPISTHNYTGPVTLLEICKNHGYGFFNTCMHFWVACLVLHCTTWISYRNTTLVIKPDQIPSLPDWMKLPDIPEWMNPRLAASNIVTCAPHYFEPNAGFWGAQCASFPMGAALHYYAATGAVESEEIKQLQRLLLDAKLGDVTGRFLRSMANSTDSAKGDPRNKEEHKKIAASWYGLDAIRSRE